jgi:hypothetical protein
MTTIIGVTALAVSAVLPIFTARAVLGAVVALLGRHGDVH